MSVSFEIKSAQLSLVALHVKTSVLALVIQDFLARFGPRSESPDFFDLDALVIDFSTLPADTPVEPLAPLIETLRSCQLVPVAFRGIPDLWRPLALEAGLAEAPADVVRVRADDVVKEGSREVQGSTTMVVDKPLRSGQKIYARGGDLVVLAMVNQGAEVVADGNIHVYAPLRGKAMAGARGNTSARIFSLCLEPELISIAGVYRTSENPLPKDIHGKAAQVRLSNDGQDKLLIEALKN